MLYHKAVADLTGSRAYERFTGNQIAKIAAAQPEVYAGTERISLVSSALPSILLGRYAPIDHSDGCGMNLMDLKGKAWAAPAMDATAPDLAFKLGAPCASHALLGTVSPYFVSRYGFAEACQVMAWSGDNPNSVAGLGLGADDVALSMGTSDTLFGITKNPQPATEGHVFVNPVDPESYMAMLCYKNGSLNRERIRNTLGVESWDDFSALLAETPPGNSGAIGIYIGEPEITPPLPRGEYRFDESGAQVEGFSKAQEARALVEGMALSMRSHAASIGVSTPGRIIATGGASANTTLLQVVADVFGVNVYTADSTDSASLGAALRALHGAKCAASPEFVPFSHVYTGSLTLAAEPKVDPSVYSPMIGRYKELEVKILQ